MSERYEKELGLIAKKSRSMALLIKRANTYFPTIEAIFKKEGVPSDLKYIALVESGLQPKVSRKKAVGFWQIMPHTAQYLDLTLNEEIDERLHFEKSTIAAARLLKIYYRQFGSWANAIAAYNIGSERLKQLMRSQQEQEFYNLYANKETSRFIFKILAYKSLFENPESFGFLPLKRYGRYQLPSKRVVIKKPIPSLEEWSKKQNLNVQEVRVLNPWIVGNTLKNIAPDKPLTISLPGPETQKLIAESLLK